MEETKRYSNQQSNLAFQPQTYRQSGFEQVSPGRTELHSSSDPGNGNKTSDSIKMQSGDTLWNIAESELRSGSRWTELQKHDGSAFTNQEAANLKVRTEVFLPKVESTSGSQPVSALQTQLGEIKTTSDPITLEPGKSSDRILDSLEANGNPVMQSEVISFSGADLIKATQLHPESISLHYQGIEDNSHFAQEDTRLSNTSDNQHLLGLSEDEYIAQRIIGDAAAGYWTGDLAKKLANKVNETPSQTVGGKSRGFVSADAEELGRRITEDRKKTGGQQHPFERLGKYDAETGKFTFNPHLGVDEVTVHETRPIIRRPEGRVGDTWPSLYHQKGPGDRTTQDAAKARTSFRTDMNKLIGDAITKQREATGEPSDLERLGKYDPDTKTFKLDSNKVAGHTTTAHSNGPDKHGRDMFALEDGSTNSRDGRRREDPRKGGEVLRKRAVDIHGFAVEKELARKLFPELAENAPSHPGYTRGVKVTDKSLDIVRDHLLKAELQTREKASAAELSKKIAAGKATDADLTDPRNQQLVKGLREELREVNQQEREIADREGRKAKPQKLSFEQTLDELEKDSSQRAKFGELQERYGLYVKTLRDAVNDRRAAKSESGAKSEGTESRTRRSDSGSHTLGRDTSTRTPSSKAQGKAPFIAHRDKPDEANPEKKRSVNPADRSPRQSEGKRGLNPRDESPTPQTKEKPRSPESKANSPRQRSEGGRRSPTQTTSFERPKINKPSSSGISNGLKKGAKGLAKGAGKVFKPLGFAMDAYDLGNAMHKDGGIGENTKKVVKDGAISWGSAAAGAGIGAAVGGPPGALVGGIVGGLAPVAVEYGPKAAKKVGSWVKGLFD